MLTKPRFRWLISLILGGVLLLMALMGGNWGSDYSARASIDANPVIDYIVPSLIPAGSPDTVIIIGGSNFGNIYNTRVRIKGDSQDKMLKPKYIISTGISVNITDTLMVNPTVYELRVYRSDYYTIPSIPTFPEWDKSSNPVNLTVYEPIPVFLPIIKR